MIQQAHRFHGRRSLNLVFKRGQVLRGPLLLLKYIHNSRIRGYRTAVVVSRKVSKSAVVRNRIRRRIYEAVREVENQIGRPYDLVFIVRVEGLARIKSSELRHAVHGHLLKAGVLTKIDDSAKNRDHGIVVAKEKNT